MSFEGHVWTSCSNKWMFLKMGALLEIPGMYGITEEMPKSLFRIACFSAKD